MKVQIYMKSDDFSDDFKFYPWSLDLIVRVPFSTLRIPYINTKKGYVGDLVERLQHFILSWFNQGNLCKFIQIRLICGLLKLVS